MDGGKGGRAVTGAGIEGDAVEGMDVGGVVVPTQLTGACEWGNGHVCMGRDYDGWIIDIGGMLQFDIYVVFPPIVRSWEQNARCFQVSCVQPCGSSSPHPRVNRGASPWALVLVLASLLVNEDLVPGETAYVIGVLLGHNVIAFQIVLKKWEVSQLRITIELAGPGLRTQDKHSWGSGCDHSIELPLIIVGERRCSRRKQVEVSDIPGRLNQLHPIEHVQAASKSHIKTLNMTGEIGLIQCREIPLQVIERAHPIDRASFAR